MLPITARTRLDRLVPAVYTELRRLARRQLRRERAGHTLATTALVHEAWLDLARVRHLAWDGGPQVLAAAAGAMRRVLIDHAVARRAHKRGGGVVPVSLGGVDAPAAERDDRLLALDEALERLARERPRAARVVECRYFGGLSVEETAAALGTSPATVKREWTLARAWLYRELEA